MTEEEKDYLLSLIQKCIYYKKLLSFQNEEDIKVTITFPKEVFHKEIEIPYSLIQDSFEDWLLTLIESIDSDIFSHDNLDELGYIKGYTDQK